MSHAKLALLEDHGVIAVTGSDAKAFLEGLVTNDVDQRTSGNAQFAGLLTPQGKILFEFFMVPGSDGYFLETGRDKAADLAKRLGLYKLRAHVSINDLSANYMLVAAWDGEPMVPPLALIYRDPRDDRLGWRMLMAPEMAHKLMPEDVGSARYHAHRIACGVPEGGKDYLLGDTFPHEANFDARHGVSFTKGCFVGQEVVARMQHKTIVRKRVVRISGTAPLAAGADVAAGEAAIGRVGSTAGREALAMLRLDRAAEAADKGVALTAGGIAVTVDAEALQRYRAMVAARAAS